uniref:Uncharacterized protein n=1 Tax=Guillardia theta TaxID=55529 RepID=A0A7S4NQI5_GUITH|mmetsp:Transcript_29809/g.95337  ORF Transcript_29809/g.95337 Transcript_29809/m.95337 type:complete len:172 (+) Transcript_29809:384-899(+)
MPNTSSSFDPVPLTPKTIKILDGEILYKQSSLSLCSMDCCAPTCACMEDQQRLLVLPVVDSNLGTSQPEMLAEDCDLWKHFDYNFNLETDGRKVKWPEGAQGEGPGSSPAKGTEEGDEEQPAMLPPPQGVFQRTRSSGACSNRSSSRFGRLPSTPQGERANTSILFGRTKR